MTVHDLPGRHDHERGLELAATALDFELSRPEAAELEIHLTGCPTCARRAAAMRTDGMALGRPMSLLPSARVDTAIHAEIAGRRSRPQRLVLVAAAALLLLALLGATAVGAYLLRSWQTLPITVAPQPTDRVAIANPRPDASPIVAPGPSAAPIVAPIVPPLDPDFVAVGGASRGAYALRLQGDFGSEGFHGGGNCFWDQTGQPAVLDSFVVTELQAFGEQLTLSVNEPRAGTTSTSVGSLVFNRSIDGRQFGSYNSMDRAYVRFDSTGGDLRVLSFRDLAQNLADEPEEEAPFAEFHRPLGGFQGDDRLSGVVAWRCEPAVPQPTPFANPTPKCPSPEQAPEPPVVSASVGDGPRIAATAGSHSTITCSTVGTSDAVPPQPDEPLLAQQGETLRFTVPTGWRYVHWEGSDAPVIGEGTNFWSPTDVPDRPRTLELPVPHRAGDSIVSLSVVLVGHDERVVLGLALQVLVRVE